MDFSRVEFHTYHDGGVSFAKFQLYVGEVGNFSDVGTVRTSPT